MDALTPLRPGSSAAFSLSMNTASFAARVSRVTRIHFDRHSVPNHLTLPLQPPFTMGSESRRPSARANARLRPTLAGSPVLPQAESGSLALPTTVLARGCSQPRLAATLLLCASCRFMVQQCGTFIRCGMRLHGALEPPGNRRLYPEIKLELSQTSPDPVVESVRRSSGTRAGVQHGLEECVSSSLA